MVLYVLFPRVMVLTANKHCCSAPLLAQLGVFRSLFSAEETTFLEIHCKHCRILWAVLDLARNSGRNFSCGRNLCWSSFVPWRIEALMFFGCVPATHSNNLPCTATTAMHCNTWQNTVINKKSPLASVSHCLMFFVHVSETHCNTLSYTTATWQSSKSG